jgi:hypothetical protein
MLLGQAKDAVCDLIDAVLTTPKVKYERGTVVVTSVSAEVGEYLRRPNRRPTATPEADEVVYCTDVNGGGTTTTSWRPYRLAKTRSPNAKRPDDRTSTNSYQRQ